MIDKKVFVIAEAGVNHNGDIEIAKKLIEAAAKAKADAVKFQTFKAKKLASASAQKAAYQKANTNTEGSQIEMLKMLELSQEQHFELIEHCHKFGIAFLSTGFDDESLEFLNTLKMPLFKVPSGELTNIPYLKKIAGFRKPVILSTGMANLGEIEQAVSILEQEGLDREDMSILHCTTEYPTPFEDVNLNAMLTLKQAFACTTGYSDHTLGIEVPVAAVALGAKIIEKHFTLDRSMPGPDHKASLEPDELIHMVSAIRNIELALGSSIKKPSNSELKNKEIARKSLHWAGNLKAHTVIDNSHFCMLRPGNGIPAAGAEYFIGRTLAKDVSEYTQVNKDDFR